MAGKRAKAFRLIYLLLLPPYVALFWVGSYNTLAPALWGIPFFYWYQLLWVPLGVVCLLPIYLAEERSEG